MFGRGVGKLAADRCVQLSDVVDGLGLIFQKVPAEKRKHVGDGEELSKSAVLPIKVSADPALLAKLPLCPFEACKWDEKLWPCLLLCVDILLCLLWPAATAFLSPT